MKYRETVREKVREGGREKARERERESEKVRLSVPSPQITVQLNDIHSSVYGYQNGYNMTLLNPKRMFISDSTMCNV